MFGGKFKLRIREDGQKIVDNEFANFEDMDKYFKSLRKKFQ